MNLASIILQIKGITLDSANMENTVEKTINATDSMTNAVRNFANPDSLASLTPEKITTKIKDFDWTGVIEKLTSDFMTLGLRILAAILVFYIGRFIVNKLYNILRVILHKRNIDPSLSTFLLSFVRITLMCILLIIVISILGIETSSFIAIFATAGVAVGMALSGTLQNFAGGVLILLLKPYKVGDYIKFGEYQGYVKEIQIFNTIITTYDNQAIIIPNGGLSTGTVHNVFNENHIRLDWHVSISYGDDIETARKVALQILKEDSRIVTEYEEVIPLVTRANKPLNATNQGNSQEAGEESGKPSEKSSTNENWLSRFFKRNKALQDKANAWIESREKQNVVVLPKKNYKPYVAVENLGDSAVVIVIRAWTLPSNYWSVYYAINERIYKEFPLNGLHFPFPQLDVNIKK